MHLIVHHLWRKRSFEGKEELTNVENIVKITDTSIKTGEITSKKDGLNFGKIIVAADLRVKRQNYRVKVKLESALETH
ncbi:hypothetical protein JRQ81_002888 [Phrynocephalus forsythii]|uniref:Uncharacterized protein n=1 Tax=Phrynocephalus forsythii TaxID=171643 RepID=A0A9Q1AWM5_9SAUR|nr:hypothetical protein JRQ81_002888 [Phrynocephalus forsythii]